MPGPVDWDGLVLGPLAGIFGQPIVYTPSGGAGLRLVGVWDEAYVNVTLLEENPGNASVHPALGVQLSQFPLGVSPAQGDTVLVGPYVGAAVAGSGNVGNGAISAIKPALDLQPGVYVLTFSGPTAFTLASPGGASLPPGLAAGLYASAELGFTFTPGSTPMAAGDSFTIVSGRTYIVQRVEPDSHGHALLHLNWTGA